MMEKQTTKMRRKTTDVDMELRKLPLISSKLVCEYLFVLSICDVIVQEIGDIFV